jgi:hypothetical protein
MTPLYRAIGSGNRLQVRLNCRPQVRSLAEGQAVARATYPVPFQAEGSPPYPRPA